MKKPFITLSLTTVSALLAWLFFSDESIAQPKKSATTKDEASINMPPAPPKITKTEADNLTVTRAKKHFDESVKAAAKHVSNQYAASLTFPPYSQPLTAFDSDRLAPNKFNPVSVPVSNDGSNLVLSLRKYRFTYPEPIEVKLEGDNIEAIKISLMDIDSKNILATKKMHNISTQYSVSFAGDENYPRNLQILAKAHITTSEVPVIAHLQYMQPSAILTGFSSAVPNDDKMTIPAYLTVHKAGLYRLRANLYVGDKPAAHLVSRARLEKGTQSMTLNAHWSVLKAPLQAMRLEGFVIELMSPAPGQPSLFGHSEVESFTITEFPLDSLNKTPYQPTDEEQQSLRFLQNLGTSS